MLPSIPAESLIIRTKIDTSLETIGVQTRGPSPENAVRVPCIVSTLTIGPDSGYIPERGDCLSAWTVWRLVEIAACVCLCAKENIVCAYRSFDWSRHKQHHYC